MELTIATTNGHTFDRTNYFNGNYILDRPGRVQFIATQGPLEETTEDFWHMVVVNKSNFIVGRSS